MICSGSRRSAGPPRAGPSLSGSNGDVDSVRGRLGTLPGATVTRTLRPGPGLDLSTSTMAAPVATPSMSPSARKANSLPVTHPPRPADLAIDDPAHGPA